MKSTSRNPWPIAIATFFIVAAIFLGTFIAWAVRQREDLVSNDYYEREVRFQEHLDTLNRSQSFAMQALVTFDTAQQEIVISLPSQARNVTGSVHLYRPSDARLDREMPLALSVDGVQRLDAKGLRSGLWKVRVKWTVKGQEFFLDQPILVSAS